VSAIVDVAAIGGAGRVGAGAGLETLTSAGLADCFEHAHTTRDKPSIAKPAIMASFCCCDQDESVVPEIVLFVDWLLGFFSPDFQVVVIVSPPLRLAQLYLLSQASGQWLGY
jgi:hypothetical protein